MLNISTISFTKAPITAVTIWITSPATCTRSTDSFTTSKAISAAGVLHTVDTTIMAMQCMVATLVTN